MSTVVERLIGFYIMASEPELRALLRSFGIAEEDDDSLKLRPMAENWTRGFNESETVFKAEIRKIRDLETELKETLTTHGCTEVQTYELTVNLYRARSCASTYWGWIRAEEQFSMGNPPVAARQSEHGLTL